MPDLQEIRGYFFFLTLVIGLFYPVYVSADDSVQAKYRPLIEAARADYLAGLEPVKAEVLKDYQKYLDLARKNRNYERVKEFELKIKIITLPDIEKAVSADGEEKGETTVLPSAPGSPSVEEENLPEPKKKPEKEADPKPVEPEFPEFDIPLPPPPPR